MKKGISEALGVELDKDKVQKINERIKRNSELIEDIVSSLVIEHCKPLDEYMQFIGKVLKDTENPPTDAELDDWVLNLSFLLYTTSEAQETLGLKEDICKSIKMELFNETYDSTSGTVADKTAQAELATQTEFITLAAYSRAYRKVKLRAEAGSEMLQSVKKIVTRRIAEMELSKVDPGKIRVKGG